MATYLHFDIYLACKSKFNPFLSLSPEKKLKEKQFQHNMFLGCERTFYWCGEM